MQLKVKGAPPGDVYKDTIRIHKIHRHGIKSGRLAQVSVIGGKSTIAAVRGMWDGDKTSILLDLETMRRLGVRLGETYDFDMAVGGNSVGMQRFGPSGSHRGLDCRLVGRVCGIGLIRRSRGATRSRLNRASR